MCIGVYVHLPMYVCIFIYISLSQLRSDGRQVPHSELVRDAHTKLQTLMQITIVRSKANLIITESRPLLTRVKAISLSPISCGQVLGSLSFHF